MPPPPTDGGSAFPGFDDLSDDVQVVVERLAALRRDRGLSQTEVAARMRTSQSAVARLEAARGDVRVSTLQRYAQALGQTVQFGVAPSTHERDAR